jgi:hypothetical protein
MKRIFLSALLILAFSSNDLMAKTAYNKADKIAQVGIGVGGLGGFYGTSSIPVISVGLDFGIEDYISVGGVAGYTSSKYDGLFGFANATYRWKYTYFTLGARGSYHFLQIPNEKFDVYAGLGLGYNIVSSSYDGPAANKVLVAAASGSYLFFAVHAGGRYYFSKNFAGYAELGYGLGILNIGIAMRI